MNSITALWGCQTPRIRAYPYLSGRFAVVDGSKESTGDLPLMHERFYR